MVHAMNKRVVSICIQLYKFVLIRNIAYRKIKIHIFLIEISSTQVRGKRRKSIETNVGQKRNETELWKGQKRETETRMKKGKTKLRHGTDRKRNETVVWNGQKKKVK